MSDDCCRDRSIPRDHDRAHAEAMQFRDERDGICPRWVAESDHTNDLKGSRGSRGYRQNPEALLLKFVNDRSCSGRWSGESYNCGECSLDDALCVPRCLSRGCFRCFLSGVERQKIHQFWQVRSRLVRSGKTNRFINRILTAFGACQGRQPENVSFVEAGQGANAVYGKLVLGECSRFVRAQDIDRSEEHTSEL